MNDKITYEITYDMNDKQSERDKIIDMLKLSDKKTEKVYSNFFRRKKF